MGISGKIECAEVGDQRFDLGLRRGLALHALGERLDHGVVEPRFASRARSRVRSRRPGAGSAPSSGSGGGWKKDLASHRSGCRNRGRRYGLRNGRCCSYTSGSPIGRHRGRGPRPDGRARESLGRPARSSESTEAEVCVDDLDCIGQIVRDEEGTAVGRERQLGRPAPERDPAEPRPVPLKPGLDHVATDPAPQGKAFGPRRRASPHACHRN